MNNLVNQLNKMKATGPDQAWVVSCREKLLSSIECSQLTVGQKVTARLNIFSDYLLLSPVKVLAVFFITVLVFSSSIMAKASLPGSIFYPSRVIVEKVELLLATNSISEAKVLNKHLRQKLADLKQLANNSGSQQDVQGMAKRIEKDMAAALSSLDVAKTENGSESELGQVAMDISDNIKSASVAIKEAKSENINVETLTVLDDVLQTTATAEDKTLQLLVKMYDDNQISAEETVNKLIAIIDEQLVNTSEKIQKATKQADDQDQDKNDHSSLYAEIRSANNMLKEAKKLAADKKYSEATEILSKLKESLNQIKIEE